MGLQSHQLYLSFISLSSFCQAANAHRFQSLEACAARVAALNNSTSAPKLGPLLNLDQCLAICGTGYGKYGAWSAVSSITSLVVPLFLLIGNMPYTGGAMNYFAVVSQLLSNPIDFIWSLATKLDAARRIANRIEPLNFDENVKDHLMAICFSLDDDDFGDIITPFLENLEAVEVLGDKTRKAFASAGNDLRFNRVRNIRRAVLAIVVYVTSVAATTLLEAGTTQDFPLFLSHTIAFRALYYWILLAVALSTAIGAYPSRFTCHAILTRLQTELNDTDLAFYRQPLQATAWTGGTYAYRPYKDLSRYPQGSRTSSKQDYRWLLLLSMSFISVLSTATASFLISWFTPTYGMGDRALVELSFVIFWILNFMISYTLGRGRQDSFIYIVLSVKDLIFAVSSLYVLLGAFQGWYNNCKSWGAFWSRGYHGTIINLELKDIELARIRHFYPALVGAAFGVQLFLAIFIFWLNRSALRRLIKSANTDFLASETEEHTQGCEMNSLASTTRVHHSQDQEQEDGSEVAQESDITDHFLLASRKQLGSINIEAHHERIRNELRLQF